MDAESDHDEVGSESERFQHDMTPKTLREASTSPRGVATPSMIQVSSHGRKPNSRYNLRSNGAATDEHWIFPNRREEALTEDEEFHDSVQGHRLMSRARTLR